jgi:murein DD-endopeptidase MepM/ murein hydrolase activator NlpD
LKFVIKVTCAFPSKGDVAMVLKGNASAEPVSLPQLDARSNHEWRSLSSQILAARRKPGCARTNIMLRSAAEREPQSPLSSVYRLWGADNLMRDGRPAEAIAAYDSALFSLEGAPCPLDHCDLRAGILSQKAGAAALAGDPALAIKVYEQLGAENPTDADALLQAGILAEKAGELDRAAELYSQAAQRPGPNCTDSPAELARRALKRLEVDPSRFAATSEDVAGYLIAALERRDFARLAAAASTTHFVVGLIGGHTSFEVDGVIDALQADLAKSRIRAHADLKGAGDKRYLFTKGWRGRWYRGQVAFIITRAPAGWQWTGIGIVSPNNLWIERWRPLKLETNQALPFELLAPWPADQCFMAGGFVEFGFTMSRVLASPFGWFIAFNESRSCCGFGPRGLYYNQPTTHDDDEAFAIDFTRYKQYAPFWFASEGTPVLAARDGIVTDLEDKISSGDNPGHGNFVHISHADPANPSDTTRFTSRYLHLAGPHQVNVSRMMPVMVGTRLGLMDDTGNSAINHLHFSIHDRQIPHPQNGLGASVRPTPMSGFRLEDGDDGTCVRSNNVEFVEDPMITVTEFAGQNWLIMPAALAVGEAEPANVADQAFLLVLSGVAMLELQGNSTSNWRRDTLLIMPDVNGPLTYAIDKYGIPAPSGSAGSAYWAGFEVEQWAPFAALSSMYNQDQSDNSGFAVDLWRPNPFGDATDFADVVHHNIFSGIQVDAAVRDTDAYIYRVSYNFALLGRIVVGPYVIL